MYDKLLRMNNYLRCIKTEFQVIIILLTKRRISQVIDSIEYYRSRYMKKYLKTFPEKCIACRACEVTCSKLYFKVADAEKSCIRITENPDGNDINVCNQCQTCVSICPTMALKVNANGVVTVDKSLCVSCYMCVSVCPTKSMHIHKDSLYPFKCIACGLCTKSCSTEAIKIVQE